MYLTETYRRRLRELAGIKQSWMPEYFYHFTPTKNTKNILKGGLIPKYKPNREYFENEFTSNAVYLTNTPLIDSANLPSEIRGFEIGQPLTILKIDSSYLNQSLFVVDDDYYSIYMVDDETIKDMSKEIRNPDKLLDSLSKETGVAYEGIIPKEAITVYKNLKKSLNENFNIKKHKRRLQELAGIKSPQKHYETESGFSGNSELFFHITLTKNVNKIKKEGIKMLQPTNWVTGLGQRYGDGAIFAMTNKIDAIRWAGKMDWEFNKEMGSGKISIVEFESNPNLWAIDKSDPIHQVGNIGKWIKSYDSVNPKQIKSIKTVNSDAIKSVIKESLNENFNIKKYKTFDSLTNQDLRDIARWGLLGDYSYSGAWDCADSKKERIEEAIQCSIDDFKEMLILDFPEGLKGFPNPAKLYRVVAFKSVEQLNKKNLGLSWFANIGRKDEPQFFQQLDHLTHKARKVDERVYLISAMIPTEKISIPKTLWQRSLNSWENEVVLNDDGGIEILEIKEI